MARDFGIIWRIWVFVLAHLHFSIWISSQRIYMSAICIGPRTDWIPAGAVEGVGKRACHRTRFADRLLFDTPL